MKWLLIFFAALHLCVSPLYAADKPFIPDPAKFAPMSKARYLRGAGLHGRGEPPWGHSN